MIMRVASINEKMTTTNIFKIPVYRFARRPCIQCLLLDMYTSTNLVFLQNREIRFRILRIQYPTTSLLEYYSIVYSI